LTSSATREQPLLTPSKNIPFTPILNEVNGVLHQSNLTNSKGDNHAKIVIEKLTIKSPLKEPKKIKFLDDNPYVKAGANKVVNDNVPPVVKIGKEAVNKANIKPTNATKQVKNYPMRKSQGVRV
jgi:hypothetical protein